MSTQRAFDDAGNEVFQVTLNAICPVEFADLARPAVFAYIVDVEKPKMVRPDGTPALTVNQMLNLNIGPIGTSDITHVFCSRIAFTHQVEWSLEEIARLGFPWCGNREFTLADDPAETKSQFCVITGDMNDVLDHLGLEVKP